MKILNIPKIARWFSVWLGLWLLVACTAPTPDPNPLIQPTLTPARAINQLTFLAYGDVLDQAAYQNLIAAFEAQQSGVKVNLVLIPDQRDYDTRLVTDFTAATPPDVALISYRRIERFSVRHLLEPLGGYLAASTVISANAFYPAALLPFQGPNGPWCLPQSADTLVVYYNRTLFDQAGVAYPTERWTWEDFVSTAQALTRDTNGDGMTDVFGAGWKPALTRVAPLVWQGGGLMVNRRLFPREIALNQPEALRGLRWYTNLQNELHVAPDAVANASEALDARFVNGRLAMWVETRRVTAQLRAGATFAWDVAPLPRNRGRHTNLLLADGYCIAAQSPNKAAAWAFVEFATSPAGQTLLAQTGRWVPSLPSVAESPMFLDPALAPAHADRFLTNLADAQTLPILENWVNIETLADNALERAFYGQITIDEAMNDLAPLAEEYFTYTTE